MFMRTVALLALSASLFGLLSRTSGHAQDASATKAKRAVYFVRHGDARDSETSGGVSLVVAVPLSGTERGVQECG